MKILHLMRQDGHGAGGAFNTAYFLYACLKSAGIQSKIAVAQKLSSDSDVIQLFSLRNRVQKHMMQKLFFKTTGRPVKKAGWFSVDRNWAGLSMSRSAAQINFKPDLIFVHFVADFLTPKQIFQLHRIFNAPVVWNMIDMAPLTGGCHYAFECRKYLSICQNCPLLQSNHNRDMAYFNWTQRADVFKRMSVNFVAYCSWLEKNIEKSALRFNRPVFKTFLPIDPDMFKKSDKTEARRRLGLAQDKKIIYFGAHSLQDPRKGYDYFLKALQVLAHTIPKSLSEKIFIILASSDRQIDITGIPFPHRQLGFLKTAEELALSYQACDVYACASIQDAGPLMINEAMMCGSPVVAFEMGVAPDLVKNGRTGYRAALRNSAEFAAGLEKVIMKSDSEYQRMSSACREMALKYCHPQVYVNSMLQIIATIRESRQQPNRIGHE